MKNQTNLFSMTAAMNIKVKKKKKNKGKMAEQTNREWKEHFLDTQHSHAYVSISNLYTVSMHHSKVLTLFYSKFSSY